LETLLLRVLQGHATEAERAALMRWREASPENEARYREQERLWELLGKAAPTVPVSEPPSGQAIVDMVSSYGHQAARWPQRSRRTRALASLAAAAVIVVALGVIRPWRDDVPAAVAAREFATGRAEG